LNITKKKQLTLGWSISRYDKFINCKRRYFYDYYSKFDLEIPLDKIQRLKNLTSKALEIGNIVHMIIKTILKRYQITNQPINMDKLFQYTFNVIKKNCTTKMFFETHYYHEKIILTDIYTKVKICLNNFLNSKRFKWIINNKVIMSKNHQWIIDPEGYGDLIISNYKIFCKVDFLFPLDKKLCIIDWKTGKKIKTKHYKQLIVYLLWAHISFKQNVHNIVSIVSYLYPQYDEQIVTITKDYIGQLMKVIISETQQMYKYLIDIETNIPKPKENFQLTTNRFHCKYCNYKEICF
jgi:hypothetical protein